MGSPEEYEEDDDVAEESLAQAGTESPDPELVEGRRWLRADHIISNIPTKDQTQLKSYIYIIYIYICSSYLCIGPARRSYIVEEGKVPRFEQTV